MFKTHRDNKNFCRAKERSNKGYLCMFKTFDIGQYSHSLNLAETDKCLKFSSKNSKASHFWKLSLSHVFTSINRDWKETSHLTSTWHACQVCPWPNPLLETHRPSAYVLGFSQLESHWTWFSTEAVLGAGSSIEKWAFSVVACLHHWCVPLWTPNS